MFRLVGLYEWLLVYISLSARQRDNVLMNGVNSVMFGDALDVLQSVHSRARPPLSMDSELFLE